MSVKTEQTNELVTFEQLDELAKEIYVARSNNESISGTQNLLEQAYTLAGDWFLSKNERFKLWNEFNYKQLKLFYSSKENRDNAGWYEPELEREDPYSYSLIPLNVQLDEKEIGSLENGASYWVIDSYSNSVPEIAVFCGLSDSYHGKDDKLLKVYLFKRTNQKKDTFCIRGILLTKVES